MSERQSETTSVREVHLDVRCKMCKSVGGAYCDECAAGVFAVGHLWAERNKLHGALGKIADAPLKPPTPSQAVAMQTTAREALGRNAWTNGSAAPTSRHPKETP